MRGPIIWFCDVSKQTCFDDFLDPDVFFSPEALQASPNFDPKNSSNHDLVVVTGDALDEFQWTDRSLVDVDEGSREKTGSSGGGWRGHTGVTVQRDRRSTLVVESN
jgi:hypothetical protein